MQYAGPHLSCKNDEIPLPHNVYCNIWYYRKHKNYKLQVTYYGYAKHKTTILIN